MQPNLPLLIKCAILPRFSYGANKQEAPKEYELKVKGMRHLANTKEDFIKQVTLDLPLTSLTSDVRINLVKKLKENPGTALLTINVLDYTNKLSVEFISTKFKVSLDQEMLNYLNSVSIGCSFTPTLSF
jgi:hypothetical protein